LHEHATVRHLHIHIFSLNESGRGAADYIKMHMKQYNYDRLDWVINTNQTQNSREEETTLANRNGTSTQATKPEAQHRAHAQPPLKHHKPITTLHHQQLDDKVVRTKMSSSPLVLLLPTLSHTEVARCKARLIAVVCCKP
jgi:hypothetical protein